MAASEGQAEPETSAEQRKANEERTSIAQTTEAASAGGSDPKPKFDCEHCGKQYLTRKSLLRHTKSNDTACAKQRLRLEEAPPHPPKPRWACSRCGKDCATGSSVDRHISRSCWKTCDECATDGVTRCDSVVKNGPCRTCEAKERPCTKHTDPIPGTMPIPLTGPAAPAREKTPSDEGASATAQNAGKRRLSATPGASTAGAHQTKRQASVNQPVGDHGLGRIVDPLGGQAHVPSLVKNAAVSDWLQQQASKSASAASLKEEKMQGVSPHMDGFGTSTAHCSSQQRQQLFESSQNFARALPTAASYLPTHRGNGTYYHHPTPPPSSFNNFHAVNYGLTAPPPPLSLPKLPDLNFTSSSSSSTQLDGSFLQVQATHHQQSRHQPQVLQPQALRQQVLQQQYGHEQQQGHQEPWPLHFNALGISRAQSATSALPLEHTPPSMLSPTDATVALRIHSNTHDTHGQPIFSILHMRRNEIFGPRLNAYCINRGKEYGVDWMFVYRYHDPSYPKQYKQIALTWDMTPADVNGTTNPSATIQHLDTIYVVQAKPLTHSGEVDAALPGPQLARTNVDIRPGETPLYQSPDVNMQWYRAVEHDSIQLRAQQEEMKKTIARQQARIAEQDEEIATQGRLLGEMTELSRQLRGRMRIPTSDPLAEKLERQWTDAESHVFDPEDEESTLQLIPEKAGVHGTGQQTTQGAAPLTTARKRPTPFVTACEAVRAQSVPTQRSAIRFPTSTSNASIASDFSVPASYTHVPAYSHVSNVGAAFNSQTRGYGRFVDTADKVGAEAFTGQEAFDGGEEGVGGERGYEYQGVMGEMEE